MKTIFPMIFPFSYVVWQYTGGFLALVRIWWNYLRFVPYFFNIARLLRTLLSPWKRDVTPKSWRGFELARSLERITFNIFSRFIGMVVRFSIVIFGLFMWVVVLVAGILAVVFWLTAIPLAVFSLYVFVTNPALSMMEIEIHLLPIVFLALSLVGYFSRLPETFLPKDRADLFEKSWFPRVLARLGIPSQEFRREEWLSDEALERKLLALNITHETFDEIVAYEAGAAERRMKQSRSWLWENLRKSPPLGHGWEYGYTVHLDQYCTDLSDYDYSEYRQLHLFGRESELEVVTLIMRREGQNNILLVGDAGIGKKTFVHALARKIREGDIPGFESLRFLIFDLGMAVGDAMNRSEDVENYLRHLFMQAAYAGNVVLVIEDLEHFFGGIHHDTNRPNLAPLFAEFLALSTFEVIGTMGTVGYHDIVRADESVVKFFEAVYLREPEESATIRILLNIMEPVERIRAVFTWKALKSIVAMSGEYNWDAPYPEKAIDLAQQTLLHWESDMETPFILPSTVATFVSLKTGMPVGALEEEEKDRLLHLEEILHRRVIGQSEAVRQVSDALRRARAGFGNPKRPLGSFLFLGPTGSGKTETAKALAEAYFGNEDRMIRLDMSEFQGVDAVERLIGSNATGETGQLTEAAKEHPYGVILLDEIEKAYPKALDIFLQVLDEGFVTDGFGKKLSFRKSIIIATSNASSGLIAELLGHGKTPEQSKREVIDSIVKENIFRLEFLNRFDDIIFFSPLVDQELREVATLKLVALAARIKKQKNIDLSFDESVPAVILARGYEPEFGARSMNRYIEDKIEDAVVKKVISGEVAEGGSLIITEADLG